MDVAEILELYSELKDFQFDSRREKLTITKKSIERPLSVMGSVLTLTLGK